MRVPLSWLLDFVPFEGEPAALAATLDDLGLVVEGIEVVGEGLGDIVVARVEHIASIEGADRIRRVVVDAGGDPLEVVCGAWNFEEGDLVPLAPVGSVLPGGFEIGRRKMKGVASNGMLCSGRELGLSDDGEGILVLDDVEGASPGAALTAALGIESDVIFDVAVEANRPDALCISGVARDVAARLGLPFVIPDTAAVAQWEGAEGVRSGVELAGDMPVESLASVQVEDFELCPRFTGRVVLDVVVGPSPQWIARRLTRAGMRPINNVVDASNYVMLELGQPTHPYDLDLLPGRGLLVRSAVAGESMTTLDGVVRPLGEAGPGLGDSGQDCLICDAEGDPVGIGGIMGGASSEISGSTRRVLLESAYFAPMAIARTSKRLRLRTEASARFERGCDPAGIDRAAERYCELLSLSGGPSMSVASGVLDARGTVPTPVRVTVGRDRVNALLGTEFGGDMVEELISPLGFRFERDGHDTSESDRRGTHPEVGGSDASEDGGGARTFQVVVPTRRPDIRPDPMGEADIAEEVARIYGYSRLVRRMPSWPQPGRLSRYQRERRLVKGLLSGLGSIEAWTATFVTASDELVAGFEPPYVEVTNPLVESERYLRSSMMPGLVRAVAYNADRRQGAVRFFEVGTVFQPSPSPPKPQADRARPESGEEPAVTMTERMSAVFAGDGDDAWTAVNAWRMVAEAVRLADWEMETVGPGAPASATLHPYRSAAVRAVDTLTIIGTVGELHPAAVAEIGLLDAEGRPRRLGWLDLDLGVLLDPERAPRLAQEARPVSRFPSADIDLAFVVRDEIPAGAIERTLRASGGDLLHSVALFDVYRGPPVEEGSRNLAFHLRFCALDHTLTEEEVAALRGTCIATVTERHGASLRDG